MRPSGGGGGQGQLAGAHPERQAEGAPGVASPGDVAGRPLGDDPAAHEHDDAVGEGLGFVEVVHGEQDRGAVRAQAPDELPGTAARRGVEAGRGLVEEQHVGAAHDPLSNAEIAGRLVVSEATVKSHVNHLFAKAGVRDRAQAVTYAFRHGLGDA